MKQFHKAAISLASAVCLIVIASCVSSQSFNMVRGNGNQLSKDFNLSDFQAIEVSSGFDVKLLQGSTEGVTLTADENLFDYITCKVEDGILKIYTDKNIIESRGLKARIAFKNIVSLKVSGGGDVSSESGITADQLTVNLSGGGDLNTSLQAAGLKCSVSGGGDVKLSGTIKEFNLALSGGGDLRSEVTADKFNFSISGGGDVEYSGTGKTSEGKISISGGGDLQLKLDAQVLDCSISGGGDANISGEAISFEVSINGGGDLHAGDLKTETTTFHANGGSDIQVYASKELKGSISGGGNVYYSGNPDSLNIDAKGGSEVHKGL